jgi:hypothetical protein
MKKIIAPLLFAFTLSAFGQDDDVEKTRAFTFHIDPIYTEAYGTNTSVGIGWRTEIMFKRFLSLDLKFRSARYSDRLLKEYNADQYMRPTEGISKYKYFEPSLTFHLRTTIKRESLSIRLNQTSSTSGNTTTTTTTSTGAIGNVKRVLGLKIGMNFINTPIDLGSYDADKAFTYISNEPDTIITPTTTTYTTSVVNISPGTKAYTQGKSYIFSIGLSKRRITNVEKVYNGYGKKGNRAFQTFYADILIGGWNFENINSPRNYSITVKADRTKDVGWRIGYQYKKTNGIGVSYCLELGARPGYVAVKSKPFGPRTFMNMVVGISLVRPKKSK